MTKSIEATTEVETCNRCNLPMVERPKSRMTAEQAWCGVWHDCPKCHGSVLTMSEALKQQNEQLNQSRAASRRNEARSEAKITRSGDSIILGAVESYREAGLIGLAEYRIHITEPEWRSIGRRLVAYGCPVLSRSLDKLSRLSAFVRSAVNGHPVLFPSTDPISPVCGGSPEAATADPVSQPKYPCSVCGREIGWDAPSGVCSRECLYEGQGFPTPEPIAPAPEVGDAKFADTDEDSNDAVAKPERHLDVPDDLDTAGHGPFPEVVVQAEDEELNDPPPRRMDRAAYADGFRDGLKDSPKVWCEDFQGTTQEYLDYTDGFCQGDDERTGKGCHARKTVTDAIAYSRWGDPAATRKALESSDRDHATEVMTFLDHLGVGPDPYNRGEYGRLNHFVARCIEGCAVSFPAPLPPIPDDERHNMERVLRDTLEREACRGSSGETGSDGSGRETEDPGRESSRRSRSWTTGPGIGSPPTRASRASSSSCRSATSAPSTDDPDATILDLPVDPGEWEPPAEDEYDDYHNADGYFSPWMRPAYEPMSPEEEEAFRAFMAF